jgi:hypothetical protein
MSTSSHFYRVGLQSETFDSIPSGVDLGPFVAQHRKRIEPWLSGIFQAEHLNLLVGSGLTIAVANLAGAKATGMGKAEFLTEFDEAIDRKADEDAKRMQRGSANIEDQFRNALALIGGLVISDPAKAQVVRDAVDAELLQFLKSLLESERGIAEATGEEAERAMRVLQSFLLSFASRAPSRERLHVFSTNYDRLIEFGCDAAGLRTLDRFVGALNPVFRASRLDVDMHYNPPGIRGEPRVLEGVIRLTKLHGSLDWCFDAAERRIFRTGLPFGAPAEHSEIPTDPVDTVMNYPNAAKDVETTDYPYAELFRDFAAAVCRPNSVVVTYGYGYGDDHVNRILLDMLSIPSTHLLVITRSLDERLSAFLAKTREAQVSQLGGTHFSDLETLTRHYLPKPALDYISTRMATLLKNRTVPSEPLLEPRLTVTPAPSARTSPFDPDVDEYLDRT